MNTRLTALSACLLVLLSAQFSQALPKPFSKIIVWGHRMNGHTHMWIHAAFYRTFAYMGYDVAWLDDADDIQEVDFSNCLFITEGQVDTRIPLRTDCRYILHNCYSQKYQPLIKSGNAINLQVYTHKCEENNVRKMDDYIYSDIENRFIYMPWATDLMPAEINAVKRTIARVPKKRECHWVGTLYAGDQFSNLEKVRPFMLTLEEYGVAFFSERYMTRKENMDLIQKSIVAPAIVGEWQEKEGYIPCRIFKNISYGAMGVTNSQTVYELFNKKIIYNPDTAQLCHDALAYLETMDITELYDLMDFVRDKHTYVNRIDHLLHFLHAVKPLKHFKPVRSAYMREAQ